ncbi:MAG: Toluene-4-sulfonate monooxygenase system iron-sulfur subunit TsaM1, partial [Pseudomonadota bacterium]
MFLKNEWYVACRVDEITDKPFGRKICNESMVFFRGLESKLSAVEDFCPHRGAPLSLGRVCNGQLVCGYHGLTMGCDGHTVSMPGHNVRGFEPVKSFPVIERYGFVWVWPGDVSKADPSKMPVFEW